MGREIDERNKLAKEIKRRKRKKIRERERDIVLHQLKKGENKCEGKMDKEINRMIEIRLKSDRSVLKKRKGERENEGDKKRD